tara:strand:- start:730 stop:1314 length:585 start_codon:yes stop_codon:yes gene_type:complete
MITIEKVTRLAMKHELTHESIMLLFLLSRNPARNKKGKETDRKLANEYFNKLGDYVDFKLLVDYGYVSGYDSLFAGDISEVEVSADVQIWFWTPVKNFAKELWDLYPRKLKVGDNEFNAKNLSLAKFSSRYNAIGLSPEQHTLVMNTVKWAVDNNALKVGMIKFLELEHWQDLWDEMLESDGSKSKRKSNITIL